MQRKTVAFALAGNGVYIHFVLHNIDTASRQPPTVSDYVRLIHGVPERINVVCGTVVYHTLQPDQRVASSEEVHHVIPEDVATATKSSTTARFRTISYDHRRS